MFTDVKEMAVRRNTRTRHSCITWQQLAITAPDGVIENGRGSMLCLNKGSFDNMLTELRARNRSKEKYSDHQDALEPFDITSPNHMDL